MPKTKNFDEIYEEQEKPRRKKSIFIMILILLISVPIIYIIVQLILIYIPDVRYETAMPDTMRDYISVKGFVTMESQPISGSGNTLFYTVPEGERIITGGEVAKIFSGETSASAWGYAEQLTTEIEQLESAKKTYTEGGDIDALAKQKLEGVYSLLDGIQSENYADLDSPKASIMLASNKMALVTGEQIDLDSRIAELTAQRDAFTAQAEVLGSITAPVSGYFVPSSKFDTIMETAENLNSLSAIELKNKTEATSEYYGSDVVGHIISDYKWEFFTTVSIEYADKFAVGNKLEIAFPDYGDTAMPVKVETVTIDEENGIVKLGLLCEYMNSNVLNMRCEKAELIFGTEKGLLVDKSALHLVDSVPGVYIKYGNMIYFRKVDILQEDDHYMLISDEKSETNQLGIYDEVIVDSGGLVLENEKIL